MKQLVVVDESGTICICIHAMLGSLKVRAHERQRSNYGAKYQYARFYTLEMAWGLI